MFHIIDDTDVSIWAKAQCFIIQQTWILIMKVVSGVTEGVNYRGRNGTRPAGDRIVVLQDTNGDGQCDSSHTFVQEKA